MSNGNANGTAPNAKRLLWVGFMAILAAGVGFGIRGGILSDWGAQFGFTQTELGQITGGGLVGFGGVILLGPPIPRTVGFGEFTVFPFPLPLLPPLLPPPAPPTS